MEKPIEYLVVDTTAFIENAPLQNIAEKILTVPEVINEITSKRQLRRLVVLPYNLVVKEAFSESIQAVSDFAKKTGDFPCLSVTDIRVLALTYQLEKEHVGTNHIHNEPTIQRSVNIISKSSFADNLKQDVTGFYITTNSDSNETDNSIDEEGIDNDEHKLFTSNDVIDEILMKIDNLNCHDTIQNKETENVSGDSDDEGWITPSNIKEIKSKLDSTLSEERKVTVACITTDFAMQNVLKQMNLNVSALNGRIIKQLRTFILRCYSCFGITSIATKTFCPKCGNNTLKRVAVSVDENGQQVIHINAKHPLTSRGKKFSLPSPQGGKHPNNPILAADQPVPHEQPTRLARTKNNPLSSDYIAGYSPFIMRDVYSKSAQLSINSTGNTVKHWMRRNPNEARRKRK